MSYISNKEFLIEVVKGNVAGHSLVHKFGRNTTLGTTLAPICAAGSYQTPTSAVTLEVLSNDANDTAAGSGAQQLTLIGIDSNWDEVSQTIEMNGTSAVTAGTDLLRLTRAYVSRSGTYATASSASQQGTITVRVSGGGTTWTEIPEIATGFGAGQSLIGAYTVPAGKTAYILSFFLNIDSGKTVDLYFFQRTNANDVSSPYSGALRVQNEYIGLDAQIVELTHRTNEAYPEYTDIGWLGKTSTGTADVSVEFELLLVDN